jgi:hypothetical protein
VTWAIVHKKKESDMSDQLFDPVARQFVRIDHKKQLFLDDRMIEEVRHARRVQHHPVKLEGDPLLRQDQPWEHEVYFRMSHYSVQYDAAAKLLKCWYEDLDLAGERRGMPHGQSGGLGFAVSKDGIHWESR